MDTGCQDRTDCFGTSKRVIDLLIKDVKSAKLGGMWMSQRFDVGKQHKAPLKIIPYVGCKSGFAHIFDSLIPDNYGEKNL